jgi:hypothetical protein
MNALTLDQGALVTLQSAGGKNHSYEVKNHCKPQDRETPQSRCGISESNGCPASAPGIS